MVYLALMVYLAAFTVLDALITVVGLEIGCVELNPVVTMLGVELWIVFRMLLLGCMLTVLFAGYQLSVKHFPKSLFVLRTVLFGLDVYIGAIVFSGIFAIFSKLLL